MSNACHQFTPHTWKQDLCANCLKPKNSHEGPKPATRRTVKPIRDSSPEDTTETLHIHDAKPAYGYKQKAGNQKGRTSPVHSIESNDSGSITSSPGTSPKPRKSPKPRMFRNDDNRNTQSPQLDNSDQDMVEEDEEFYRAPSSKEIMETDETCGNGGGHYYHKYDTTAKGRSGSPVTAKRTKNSAVVAQITHKHVAVEEFRLSKGPKKMFAAPPRVMEIMSQENVVLPYNIVDVSTMPTNVDPQMLEQPPGVPAMAPPEERESSSASSTMSSTHSSAASTSPHSSPRPRHQRRTPPRDDIIPPTNPLDAHAYETIDGEDMLGPVPTKFKPLAGIKIIKQDAGDVPVSRDILTRTSLRSNALDAKRAALANIDFKNAPSADPSKAKKPQPPEVLNLPIKTPIKTEQAIEKEKAKAKSNSGGRSFFKKLFSFGSKDSKEEEVTEEIDNNEEAEVETVPTKEPEPIDVKKMGGGVEIYGRKIIGGFGDADSKHGKIEDEMREALRKKASRSESLRSQISGPVAAAAKPEVDASKNVDVIPSNSAKIPEEPVGNKTMERKVEHLTNKPTLSPKPKHTPLRIATGVNQSLTAEPNKKPALREKPATKGTLTKDTSLRESSRQLKRPPSVPPPAVPLGKVEGADPDDVSPPMSPRSPKSPRPTEPPPPEPISPKPPPSPRPDPVVLNLNPAPSGRLQISSPKLQRTSVNLEGVVATLDNMLDRRFESEVVDQGCEVDSGSSGDGSIGSTTISPKGTQSRTNNMSGRGKRVKDAPPGPPPPPPDGSDRRFSEGIADVDQFTRSLHRPSKIGKSMSVSEKGQTLPLRRPNRADQKLRSRTLTEGVPANFNSAEKSKRERRVSELLQRALPSPPLQRAALPDESSDTGDSSTTLYEDIDDMGSQSSAHKVAPLNVVSQPVMPADYSAYLEPVTLTQAPPPPTNPPPPSHISPYANKQSIDVHTKPALTMEEAYHKMAALHEETIHQLLGILLEEFGGSECQMYDDVAWRQLHIEPSEQCLYSNQTATFYRASYNMSQNKKKTILMVCKRDRKQQDGGHELSHLNVLSTAHMLEEGVEAYEVMPSSHCPPSSPQGHVLALLHYTSLTSLDQYLTQLLSLAHTDPALYQIAATLLLTHIFSGLVFLHNKGRSTSHLTRSDILVVTAGDYKENYALVNAFTLGQQPAAVGATEYLTELISQLLQPVTPEDQQDDSLLSVYCRGWKRLTAVLSDKSAERFVFCKEVCEFLMWGPTEDEVKSLSLAENRREAFGAWLAVSRCRLIARYAVEPIAPSIQQAGLMTFLLNTNPNTLFEVTKFLHQ